MLGLGDLQALVAPEGVKPSDGDDMDGAREVLASGALAGGVDPLPDDYGFAFPLQDRLLVRHVRLPAARETRL